MQQAATKHEGATVADEGKRYARDGHEPDGHGDVHKHVHQEQHRHAKGEEGAETVSRETGDANAVEQNQPKQAEPVLGWMATTGYTDPVLKALADELKTRLGKS